MHHYECQHISFMAIPWIVRINLSGFLLYSRHIVNVYVDNGTRYRCELFIISQIAYTFIHSMAAGWTSSTILTNLLSLFLCDADALSDTYNTAFDRLHFMKQSHSIASIQYESDTSNRIKIYCLIGSINCVNGTIAWYGTCQPRHQKSMLFTLFVSHYYGISRTKLNYCNINTKSKRMQWNYLMIAINSTKNNRWILHLRFEKFGQINFLFGWLTSNYLRLQ